MSKMNYVSLLVCAAFLTNAAWGQCSTTVNACDSNLPASYVPDGQFHYAMLNEDETADFGMTLFGGTTYRIVACSGTTDGNLFFTVYDKDHNEIFSNRDHDSAPYWDFVVDGTLDVIVEANLDNSKASSGCAVIMVGFKK